MAKKNNCVIACRSIKQDNIGILIKYKHFKKVDGIEFTGIANKSPIPKRKVPC